jgi:hypothetical protein
MLQFILLVTLFARFCAGSAFSMPFMSQQPLNDGEVNVMRPPTGGTYFDNPSADCKYVTQSHIYEIFSKLELQPATLGRTMDPNAKFHIIGDHPLAGKYSSLELYVAPIDKVTDIVVTGAVGAVYK